MFGPGQGQSRDFTNNWVFDLETGVVVTLIINSKGTLDQPWAVEIYMDNGSSCRATGQCFLAPPDYYSLLMSEADLTRSFRTTMTLVPDRYMIRVVARTRATGESVYTGTLAVRPGAGLPRDRAATSL